MVQIPTIGGFSPLPLAIMIPFMASQSAALAYAFGINYEYGKRSIKSMSNEKFNSLTPQQVSEMSNNRTQVEIDAFASLVPKTFPMQQQILDEYMKLETSKIALNLKLVTILADKLSQGANLSIENIINKLFGITDQGDVNINFSGSEGGNPPGFPPKVNQPPPVIKPGNVNPHAPAPKQPAGPILPAQQQAEKTLVLKLLSIQKQIVSQFEHTAALIKAGGTEPKGAQLIKVKAWKATLVKLNAQLKAASLNLNKKQQQYKDKYGVWLS